MTHLGACCIPVTCPKHLPSVRIIDFSQAGKGNSLAVQRLKLCTFSAEGLGSIHGGGTKIPQANWKGQGKKKKRERKKQGN